ncbi:hypothetical protein GX48_06557 [Paracoccidioides brasiliensis]|nr:hypothetical protein GX48_06557 [Paracoccidioides brasiliensis]
MLNVGGVSRELHGWSGRVVMSDGRPKIEGGRFVEESLELRSGSEEKTREQEYVFQELEKRRKRTQSQRDWSLDQ